MGSFRELFSVKNILLSRGFEVVQEDGMDNLLIKEHGLYDEVWTLVYNIYYDTKERTELKQYLYKKIYPTSQNVLKLIEYPKFVNEYPRFDKTFEWFAGELMITKFAAFSASFGITVKDILRNSTSTPSGDYDALIVLRDTNLAYYECKAGSFDSDQILKCYERMLSLNCQYSILFCIEDIDQEKIIWDTKRVKIPVVNLHSLNKIHIKGRQQDIVYDLSNCYIIDMTGNIENKIRTVLRVNAAKINSQHNSVQPNNEILKMLGYEIDTIYTTRYNN
jgi:hypothetical protein